VVKKAFKVYFDLASKYVSKGVDAGMLYTKKASHYVETQLLGWKEGELENIFSDAYKVATDSFYVGIDWVKKSKSKVYF